jgi:putative inorganic carbon (HCO3(-)) transporter
VRDLLVFAFVVLLLPTSFRKPFVGLLLFSWLAYMRPQNLCWGFAREMRFSFYVALTMFAGWYVYESHKRKFFTRDIRTYLLLILAAFITLGLVVSPRWGPLTTRYYVEFVKIILIALFTLSQVDSKQRLRVLMWVICGSFAFYSVKNGLMGFVTGGSTILRGPGGMLEDNNDFALAMAMNIPMLFYLSGLEAKPLLRKLCLVAIFLTAVTILLTHSRGGFLSMVASVGVICWRSGKLVQVGIFLFLAGLAFLLFAPDHVQERVFSITSSRDEDSSIRSRLDSWAVAIRMWQANPVLGVGLRNYISYALDFGEQIGYRGVIHVAHNSYLQIAAEGGTLSIAAYLGLLLSVFVSSSWLRRVARARPDLYWLDGYARMFEAVTACFLVGSTFLNRGHFDLIYHFISVVGATVIIAKKELANPPAATTIEYVDAPISGPITVGRKSPVATASMPRWGR